MTQKIKSVFVANSAYSLLTHLLQTSVADKKPMGKTLNTTLFVAGPAIRDIPVPPEHKIVWDNDPASQSAALRHVFWKQYDRGLPVYLNSRVPFAEDLLDYAEVAVQNKYKNIDIRIVSDGLSDHDTFPMRVQQQSVRVCYSTPDILGTIQDKKIQTFDVQDLWHRASNTDRQTLSHVFNISAEALDKASAKPVLVVTQPLSEDNMMTEEDKIELYRRIVSTYGADKVTIKPHPREKTDWTTVFPDAPVMPRQIPMEMVARLAKLDRIATFFSTAAFGTLPDDRVDFYAKDFRLLKSYHPETTDDQGHKSVAVSDIEETYRPIKNCNWLRLPDPDGRFYGPAKISSRPANTPTSDRTHTRV